MEPRRIRISSTDAVYYHKLLTDGHCNTAREVYEDMGCGRSCFGLTRHQLKPKHEKEMDKLDAFDDDMVVFVTDKEITPPIFRIGQF